MTGFSTVTCSMASVCASKTSQPPGRTCSASAAKVSPFAFRFHKTSVLLYVIMGWLVVVAARPLMRVLTPWEQAWLVAGGLCYMIGVPFYLWKSRHYTHAIWHVFVFAGVACHFVTVLSITSG